MRKILKKKIHRLIKHCVSTMACIFHGISSKCISLEYSANQDAIYICVAWYEVYILYSILRIYILCIILRIRVL